MPAVIIALVLLLGAGGTVAASQNDLPGDALYGVKLAAESVQAGLTFGAEAKIKNAEARADRRLDEIEKLQEHKKTPGAKGKASVEAAFTRFAEHVAEARTRLAELHKNNPEAAVRAGAGLMTALERHKETLGRLEMELNDTAAARLRAEKAVEEAEESVEATRAPSETGARERAEGKINAANNKVREVERYLAVLKTEGRDVAAAKAQLALAMQQLQNARASFAAGNYLQAFLQAQSAIKAAIDAQITVEAAEEESGAKEGEDREMEHATGTRSELDGGAGVRANVNAGLQLHLGQ